VTSTQLYRRIAELSEKGSAFVVATVVESSGSTPRKAGAKMLVTGDGRSLGTVGGGKIEAQVTADALDALQRGISRTVEYELREEGDHALGMVCGGDTRVFLEVHKPAETLLVIGAGHIGEKMSQMGKILGFRMVVLDERPEFATEERFPGAEVVVGHPGEAAGLVDIDDRTHIVIVTHGHVHDKEALRSVVTSPAAYIGMIGSRRKVRTVMTELEEEGVDAESLARVRSPIGLDLGGDEPAEIALSILGEIQARRYGREEVAYLNRWQEGEPGSDETGE